MVNSKESSSSEIPPLNDNDDNDDNDNDLSKNDECVHVVLVGGGHAHVYVLQMLRSYLLDANHTQKKQIQCTLLTRDVQTPYSGMLPGFVAGHYTYDQIHINLQSLCDGGSSENNSVNTPFSKIRLIHGSATQITYNKSDGGGGGQVYYQPHSNTNDQPSILMYDILSIDIGSTPSGIPPQKECVTPVKPISNFATNYQRLKEKFISQSSSSSSFSVENPFILLIVGGGAGGIELALAAQYNLQQEYLVYLQKISKTRNDDFERTAKSIVQTIIVTKGSTLLSQHNASVRHRMERILKERNVQVYTDVEATDVCYPMDEDDVDNYDEDNSNDTTTPIAPKKKKQLIYVQTLSSTQQSQHAPTTILFDECLWCTSAGAASWLSDNTPFDTDEGGGNFIQVKDTYECIHHPGVFAVGDCCHFTPNPRPKAGVFAVRSGPPLYANIMAYLHYYTSLEQEKESSSPTKQNVKLIPHTPQLNFLGLISTGDKYAIASRGSWFATEGRLMWKWKDYIDRKWMEQYQL